MRVYNIEAEVDADRDIMITDYEGWALEGLHICLIPAKDWPKIRDFIDKALESKDEDTDSK